MQKSKRTEDTTTFTLSMILNSIAIAALLLSLTMLSPAHAETECYIADWETEAWLALILKNDGKTVRIKEVWPAGEYEKRETTFSYGVWSLKDKILTIQYGDGSIDTYNYLDSSDMKKAGIKRYRPRLLLHTEKKWWKLWLDDCSLIRHLPSDAFMKSE